ncbi:cation:proton antiporter [Streptomyces mauvecolor]|uniref:Cation:proton antiporter n=1 Tax=Streptomyces mauvecolor TaxID=58345 RepID=A0ABV9UDK9_9ACTN
MPSSTAEPVTAAASFGTLDPTARLLFALAALLLLCRAAGALARRIGQPPVLAELAIAVLLGPGLLGALLPQAHQALFGPGTRPVLDGFGQLGAILLALRTGRMLGVGGPHRDGRGSPADRAHPPHADPREGRAVAVVGAVSFLLPLTAGVLCGLLLAPRLPHGRGPLALALFLGCALGVTAVPVLVRLLEETGLSGTPAGRIALGAAAVGDAAAWLVLAVALAVGGALTPGGLWLTGAGVLVLVPLLKWRPPAGAGRPADVSLLVAGCALAAGASAALGLHQLVGALVLGVLWGRRRPDPGPGAAAVGVLADKVLLPCFFLGFGQRIGLGAPAWTPAFAGLVLGLLAVAVAAKVVAGAACGALCGLAAPQWLRLGVLMNARGITEIVVLTVGYDAGLIDRTLLTALTLVALATTAMAGPALRLLDRLRPLPAAELPALP